MKAVIMAGGKGTRIASLQPDVPKPMIRILQKPILEHQLAALKREGITEIILVIGHLGRVIRDYFGTGDFFGVTITYLEEEEPLGTAGALFLLKDTLTDDFLLINGDIVFDMNLQRFLSFHRAKGGAATLFTHPNDHPYDSGLVIADDSGAVQAWLHREDARGDCPNRVNAGIHILSPRALTGLTVLKKTDLDRDVLAPLIREGALFAYASTEYAKDMGTPERFEQVTRDMQRGLIAARNLRNSQKAVFLDRDGTINSAAGYVTQPDALVLLDGAAEAIRKINQSGYLAILVTNQPVVARGDVTDEGLHAIHNRLETLLGRQGAYLDAIYYCPHHPDAGFAGEVPALKIDCACRKPKPGMLLKAAEDYHIDLRRSYMIGDGPRDVAAGQAVSCQTLQVGDGMSLLDAVGVIL
ncbi:HAD-IIIA family hydrolase [Oscillospiraceae bacterium CM]|nr:HAD-IIIA family hydrolase [Oscillospiraceae bacterium CM]